jgi:hypothetical protein
MATVNLAKNETATTEVTRISSREKALICYVTYVALGRADEGCSVSGAVKHGFTAEQLEGIKKYVRDLQQEQPKKEEESLSALLAKTAKSSCCS